MSERAHDAAPCYPTLFSPFHHVFHIQVLRWTIVNRTYGPHKSLYISLFLLTILGLINYGPPIAYFIVFFVLFLHARERVSLLDGMKNQVQFES